MIFNKSLLGSVTVWYNPESVYIKNIHSYSNYSNLLVIVDNSPSTNQHLFDEIESVNKIYIWNGENLGIAKALNQGINALAEKGYAFALTLDQDSSFEKAEIEKLLFAAQNLDWENVGILSPYHLQQKSIRPANLADYTPVTCVMASGNILNIEIGKSVGFFNEQLFIDHVDNEYCLRLNKSGCKVLLANAFLIHELGKYKNVYFFGKRIGGFISHSPERLYYFVRNSLYIIKKYFFLDTKYTLMEMTSLLKRFIKLFFEDDSKKRLRLYIRGIADCKRLK